MTQTSNLNEYTFSIHFDQGNLDNNSFSYIFDVTFNFKIFLYTDITQLRHCSFLN